MKGGRCYAAIDSGVFFQDQSWFDVSYATGDSRAVIRRGQVRSMYGGLIVPNPRKPSELIGSMVDYLGEAFLEPITLTEKSFRFIKSYRKGRPHNIPIEYLFNVRDGNTWVGKYNGGPTIGEGISRCIITEVPDDFFSPERIQALLEGKK